MSEIFRVNIFDLEALYKGKEAHGRRAANAFVQAIAQAQQHDLGGRSVLCYGIPRRLEDPAIENQGVFSLHFTTGLYSGPARASEGNPVVPFEMNDDELFAYDTTMQFDRKHSLAFIESKRPGISNVAIAAYFSQFADEGWEFYLTPRIDPSALKKALSKTTIKHLNARWILGPMSHQDVQGYGKRLSLMNAFGAESNGHEIEITLKPLSRSPRGLNHDYIQNIIPQLLRAAENNRVTRLRLSGRNDTDLQAEIIDLLQHKEQRTLLLEVHPTWRGIPLEIRWESINTIRQQYLYDVGLA